MARVRPQFEITTRRGAAELLERVARRLDARDCPLCGLVTPERVELHVPPERQHLWSPELRVEVQPSRDGARLLGTYGPHPHVWTMYVGVYAGIVFAAFVASVFAYAEWTMGSEVIALYALPPLALLALAAYALAFVGQGLGCEQMDELRGFVEGIVAELDRREPRVEPSRSSESSVAVQASITT